MANPFNYKDIAAAIDRYNKQEFTPVQVAPAPLDLPDVGASIQAADMSGVTGMDTVNPGDLKTGMDLASKDASMTAAKAKAAEAAAKRVSLGQAASVTSVMDKLAGADLGVDLKESPNQANTPLPDRFYGLSADIRLDQLDNDKVWQSLPHADKVAFFDQVIMERPKLFAAAAEAAGENPKVVAARTKAITALYQEKRDALAKEKPEFEISNSDWLDGTFALTKKLWNTHVKHKDDAVALQQANKAVDDVYENSKSALTKDEEKRSARRALLQQVKNRNDAIARGEEDPDGDLTYVQEASNAFADFKQAPVRTVMDGTAASMVLGTAVGAGTKALTALGLGAMATGVGAAPGAAVAAGATAAGFAGSAAVEVPFTQSDIIDGVLNDIADTSDAELMEVPRMRELMAQNGGNFARAKGALMNEVMAEARDAGRNIGLVSAGLDQLGAGRHLAGALSKKLSTKMSVGAVSRSVLAKFGIKKKDNPLTQMAAQIGAKGAFKTVAKDLAVDSIKEAGVEGYTEYSGNAMLADLGFNVDPFEGVVHAAVTGALTSGVVSGGTHAATRAADKVGQRYSGIGSQGVRVDGDYVLQIDSGGMLSRVRRTRDADNSNFAMDENTGLVRQIDTAGDQAMVDGRQRTTQELITEGIYTYDTNSSVFTAEALGMLAGDPNAPLVAGLFGRSMAAAQYGTAIDVWRSHDVQMPTTGESVRFSVDGNGAFTVLPSEATGAPVSQAAQDEANALIAQAASLRGTALTESFGEFLSKTTGPAVPVTYNDNLRGAAPAPAPAPAKFDVPDDAVEQMRRTELKGAPELAALLKEHNWGRTALDTERLGRKLFYPATTAWKGTPEAARLFQKLVKDFNAKGSSALKDFTPAIRPLLENLIVTTHEVRQGGTLTASRFLSAIKGKSTVDALDYLIADPTATPATRQLAVTLVELFRSGVISPPTLSVRTGRNSSNAAGAYTPSLHHVELLTGGGHQTLVHEVIHAVTVLGLRKVGREADLGNTKAAAIADLVKEMHRQAYAEAERQGLAGVYGLKLYPRDPTPATTAEMFSELSNPAFLQLMQGFTFKFPKSKKGAALLEIYDELKANMKTESMLEHFITAVRAIVNFVSARSGSKLHANSMHELLLAVANEAAILSADAIDSGLGRLGLKPPERKSSRTFRSVTGRGSGVQAAAQTAPAPARPSDKAVAALREVVVGGESLGPLVDELELNNWGEDYGGATRLTLDARYAHGSTANHVRNALIEAYRKDPKGTLALMPAGARGAMERFLETTMSGSTFDSFESGSFARSLTDSGARTMSQVISAMFKTGGMSKSETTLMRGLHALFKSKGIKYPKFRMAETGALGADTYGEYDPNIHEVAMDPFGTPTTIIHELLHAATDQGLFVIDEEAAAGNPRAKAIQSLFRAVYNDAKKAAGADADVTYGLFKVVGRTNASAHAEMIAELSNPSFLKLLQETNFRFDGRDPALAQAYKELKLNLDNSTLFDAFVNAVRAVLNFVSGGNGSVVSQATLADVVLSLANEAATITARHSMARGAKGQEASYVLDGSSSSSGAELTSPAADRAPAFSADGTTERKLPRYEPETVDVVKNSNRLARFGVESGLPDRPANGKRMLTLIKELDTEAVRGGDVETKAREVLKEYADRVAAAREKEAARKRVRGGLEYLAKVARAESNGELPSGTHELLSWVLTENPNAADELASSVRSSKSGQASGRYDPLRRMAELFKGQGDPSTAVHELMRHTEAAMPHDFRAALRKEWTDGMLAEYKANKDPATRKLIAAALTAAARGRHIQQVMPGDTLAQKTKALADMVNAARENTPDAYQWVNPSEFWAVNATRISTERFGARNSAVGRANQWLRELAQKAKGALGLRSDSPVLTGLLDLQGGGDSLPLSNEFLGSPDDTAIRKVLARDPLFKGLEDKGVVELHATSTRAEASAVADIVDATGVSESSAKATVRKLANGTPGFYVPATGKVYLSADGLTPANAAATMLGALAPAIVQSKGMADVMRNAERLFKDDRSPFMDEVRATLGENPTPLEITAAIAEAAETSAYEQGSHIKRFMDAVVAAVRAWLSSHGVNVNLNPDDIRAAFRANAKRLPKRNDSLTIPGYNVSPNVGIAYGPDPALNDVAQRYAESKGIALKRQEQYVEVDQARAKRIAEAYEKMEHAPGDPKVKEAFENLTRQTREQYDALKAAGYEFYFIDLDSAEGQAYIASPWTAMRDIRENKRMGVFPTSAGFGSGDAVRIDGNPMLNPTGLTWPVGPGGKQTATVYANDLFRAVHDAFGHGMEGAGFRAQGEENAWLAHKAMFTGSAVAALTTETRGQNSWMNAGPHAEHNRTASAEDSVFADQKIGLMPSWTWEDDAPPAPKPVARSRNVGNRSASSTTVPTVTGAPAPSNLNPTVWGVVRNTDGVRNKALKRFAGILKTSFVTHLAPVEAAIAAIPDRLASYRNTLGAQLYLAPNVRDGALNDARAHGWNGVVSTLGAMAQRSKRSEDTVRRDVGNYLTAKYVLTKAQQVADADQKAVDAAEAKLVALQAANASTTAIAQAQAELTKATKLRDDRQYAYEHGAVGQEVHYGPGAAAARAALDAAKSALNALPQNATPAQMTQAAQAVDRARADLRKHQVGLVAGMPRAEAEAIISAVTARYRTADLNSVGKDMARLMAYRMSLDLRSGRVVPARAAAYSPELAALRPLMDALVAAEAGADQRAKERARKAFIDAMAATSEYVPTTGSPDADSPTDIFGMGARSPNVATDRRLLGREAGRADDGITASLSAVTRSASDLGWRPFRRTIAELYDASTQAERDAMGMGGRTQVTVLQRLGDNVIIHDGYAYTFGDDTVLAAIRSENVDNQSLVSQLLQAPTSALAYAMTQLDPTFGPRNFVRDVWERTENVRHRTLTDARGRRVDGNKIANRALAIATNPSFIRDIGAFIASGGKRGADTKTATYLREALESGFGGSRRLEFIPRNLDSLAKDIANANSAPRKAFTALGKAIGAWNSAFDSGAPLAIYIAMREAGMTAEQASAKTLDLMNFRKKGSSMGILRMIWVFAQPAVTGGHQLYKTLATPGGRLRAAAYTVGFIVLKELLASLSGDDDELDKSQFDLLGDYTKDRFVPVPLPGGGFAKLPVGYGLPMLANAAAQVTRESALGAGDKTVVESVEDLLTRAVLPQFLPLDDSQIGSADNVTGMLAQTLAPTAVAPMLNVAINRNSFGNEIYREEFTDGNRHKSEQGSPYTAEFYSSSAKVLRKMSGIDLSPEQFRELFIGYTPGAFGMARKAFVDNPNSVAMGRDTTAPGADRFYISSNPGKVYAQLGRFDAEGVRLMRKTTAGLDPALTGKDLTEAARARVNSVLDDDEAAVLRLYLDYQDDMADMRKLAAALTRDGVSKDPTHPERAALRAARDHVQIAYVNRWFGARD